MTHVITSACIGSKDQSCIEVCPVECIHEADRLLVIDPEQCIDCGACIPECPVDAIFAEDDTPPDERPFVDVNAAIARGVDSVDAAVEALFRAPSTRQ